jgi:uncharacterized C2H2 Zn-finger protein
MERVDFVTIESLGAHETLACPKCGCIFDIDAHEELNLVHDKVYKGLVAKCPDCGVLQKADPDEELNV